MEFRLLGPFEVVDGGRALDLGPRKQRAVLLELAISANQVVPLDRFVDDLWGATPPSRATTALQAYISNLRRVLEPARGPHQPPQVLLTQPPGYVLRVEPEALDSNRFETGAAEGRHLLQSGQPYLARTGLQEALELWRGPALADFAFEPFARTEAARLDELRLLAIEDRIKADLDLGAHAAAVTELEELVAVHPLRESLWGLLIAGFARWGRDADALAAYDRARRILSEELGIDPSPALRRLRADIVNREPAPVWRPEAREPALGGPRSRGTGAPVGPRQRSLVGREAELTRLDTALTDAAAGRGRVVLAVGEPGIGKTRLLEEAARLARNRGFVDVWGRSLETGGTPSYWPWSEVLRSLLTETGWAVEATEPYAPHLARAFPELDALRGGSWAPPPAVDAATDRLRLFEAFAAFLRAHARRQPLLLVIDDLQWADPASLHLLSFLGPRLRQTPLLLLGAYRPSELEFGHPLLDALAALARHQVVERLELHGLSEPEVSMLLEEIGGTPPPPEVVTEVTARTGGNPFFVVELARVRPATDSLRPNADTATTLPAAVLEVVRHRLSRIPEQTRALLSVAAVAGPEFDCRLLEVATDLSADRILELLEAALMTGLISEVGDTPGHFRFNHHLIRETILSELSGVRLARLHARLGEALQNLSGDAPASALERARHFLAAIPAIGAERAIPHVLRAAELASARVDEEQAVDRLRRALDLVGQLPAGAERDRQQLEILLRLHASLMTFRGWAAPETAAVFALACQLSERVGGTRDFVQLLYGAWASHVTSARHEAAYHVAERLLEAALRSGHPGDLVIAHMALGVSAFDRGDLATARAAVEQVAGTHAGPDDVALDWLPVKVPVGRALHEAMISFALGDVGYGRERGEGAVETALAIDDPFSIAYCLWSTACMAAWDRDAPFAQRRAHWALEFCTDKGLAHLSPSARAVHGWARVQLGDATAGLSEITEALAALKASSEWALHSFYVLLLAEAQQRAGRLDEALRSVDWALEFASSTGERVWEPELHRLRGELLLQATPERVDDASAAFERAAAVAQDQGAPWAPHRTSGSWRRGR